MIQVSKGTSAGIGSTHRQPLIADPTTQRLQYPLGPVTAHYQNGPGSFNRVGPNQIDINVPAEQTLGFELQPLDVNIEIANKRARYAEARRIRREKMTTKLIKAGVLKIR